MKPKSHAKQKIIAVDFDGTCVTHEYPEIGRDVGAVPVLKELVAKGHRLALWTMRSGQYLEDAVNWFHKNEIHLSFANINPNQKEWTYSPKFYAHIYIDDAAVGAPLLLGREGERPFIWWDEVKRLLEKSGVL